MKKENSTNTGLEKGVRPAVARTDECGFTVLETAIAMVLMAIVGLGVASLFFYAARNTVSAGDRELAMAVAQQSIETLRSVPFSDASLAATSPSGTSSTVISAGRNYSILTTITDSNFISGQAKTKTITIKVTPQSDSSQWASNVSSLFGSVTLISQRTSPVMGPNRQF